MCNSSPIKIIDKNRTPSHLPSDNGLRLPVHVTNFITGGEFYRATRLYSSWSIFCDSYSRSAGLALVTPAMWWDLLMYINVTMATDPALYTQ